WIVRGTTTRGKMQAVGDAGAKEVHLRVSAPPLRWPCFYGVDFPTREELIASDRTEDEVCEYLGVDSLGYMSLDGLLSCVSQPPDNYCTACFTGNYPVPIYPESRRFIESRQLKIWEDT
ncbi:MAG: hypothetical protein QGD94_11380, partial [Planctomycetia bacterium]|nr:hypothetical protein [Planctomycetia bacterium]